MPRPIDSEAKTPDTTAPVLLDPIPKLYPLVQEHGLMEGCKAWDGEMDVWLRKFQTNLGPLVESVKTGSGE